MDPFQPQNKFPILTPCPTARDMPSGGVFLASAHVTVHRAHVNDREDFVEMTDMAPETDGKPMEE